MSRRSYDVVARGYERLEHLAFGPLLMQVRRSVLPDLHHAKRILILGEGDGRFLAALLTHNVTAHITIIDSSASMLALAQQRLKSHPKTPITFVLADVLTYPLPSSHYDAIVTLFFLDNFTNRQLKRLIPRLNQALIPGGVWLYGDFHLPQHGWQHLHARLWLSLMYLFFSITTGIAANTLTDPSSLFMTCKLTRVWQKTFRAELLESACWQKL